MLSHLDEEAAEAAKRHGVLFVRVLPTVGSNDAQTIPVVYKLICTVKLTGSTLLFCLYVLSSLA